MRNLATVQKIEEIKEIPGSDYLDAYRVLGWWVVDKKNQHSIGDMVLFFEIDSWIPHSLAPFLSKDNSPREYNGVKGERLKSIKLRGQISQGLILPLSVLGEASINIEVGLDVTELLGIQKWEPNIPDQLYGVSRGNFPHFIRKTDQDRIESLKSSVVRDILEKDDLYQMELKYDGSSITVYYNDGDTGVCSRNMNLKLDQENNSFVDMAKHTGLLNAVEQYCIKHNRNLAVQGELYGPGIQKNRHLTDRLQIAVFDVWDIDEQYYLSPLNRREFYAEIEQYYDLKDIHEVHVFGVDTIKGFGINCLEDFKTIVVRGHGKMKNIEGAVFKAVHNNFSFKSINNQYLLSIKE